jgi:mono/diheme cytochrome c family protein
MSIWKYLVVAVAVGSVGIVASGSFAQTDAAAGGEAQPAAEGAAQPAEESEAEAATDETAEATEEGAEDEGPAEFTEAFLNDPAHLAVGEEVWGTCQGCHGRSSYPGKGPKLKPARYTPEFVYDRVTNGFRKMPAWKDVFTKEERMSVTAYVLSKKFAP